MESVYSAMFNVGPAEGEKPDLEAVVNLASKWVGRVGDRAKNFKTESHEVSVDENNYFGFRITHEDAKIPNLGWQIDFGIVDNGEKLRTTVELLKGWKDSTLKKVPISLGRPLLVPQLIQTFGAHEKYDLSTQSKIVDLGNALQFSNAVVDPERRLPIIYASHSNNENAVRSFDIDDVAWKLAGLAYVTHAENPVSSKEVEFYLKRLEKDLGLSKYNGLNCFDGAVRIFWPFDINSDIYNPLIVGSSPRLNTEFGDELFRELAHHSVRRNGSVSFNKIRQLYLRDQSSKVGSKEQKEMLELALEENGDLTKTLRDREIEIQDLRERIHNNENAAELETLRENLKAYETALADARTYEIVKVPDVNSIEEAVNEAMTEFSDQLYFPPKVLKEALASPYHDAKGVYTLLEFLATIYRDSKLGLEEISNMRHKSLSATGFEFKAHQSKSTAGKYESDYYLEFDGKKFFLGEHFAKGNSFDARETIRICPVYDSESEKIVIGFFGQHQRNDKSN